MSGNKGFTLIEMMIILIIIGIISSATYPSLSRASDEAKENDRARHEYVVNKALRQHYALTGTYPNQGVHESSTPILTEIELRTLVSDLAEQTGVRLNSAKYIYTYVRNESGTYDINLLHVDLN